MSVQNVHLITLGVDSLDRAKAFYLAWGWTSHPRSLEDIVFFQMNGLALALFQTDDLAEDQGRDKKQLGAGRITLARICPTIADVDETFGKALKAGGTSLKTPQQASWGGYSGYFMDPDEHVWEIAMNPFWPLDESGHLELPMPT